MIFNLTSFVNCIIVTTSKHRKVEIDNLCENARRVRHGYAIGDLDYTEKAGIYHKSDYKKQGLYRITEVFKKLPFDTRGEL